MNPAIRLLPYLFILGASVSLAVAVSRDWRSRPCAGEPVPAPIPELGERAKELREAGAYGAAVLGGVWRSTDPAGAVARYLRGLES